MGEVLEGKHVSTHEDDHLDRLLDRAAASAARPSPRIPKYADEENEAVLATIGRT
jgi:hypothetical protein